MRSISSYLLPLCHSTSPHKSIKLWVAETYGLIHRNYVAVVVVIFRDYLDEDQNDSTGPSNRITKPPCIPEIPGRMIIKCKSSGEEENLEKKA